MKHSTLIIALLFIINLTSCKDKKDHIEYILHNDKSVLWGIYNVNFISKDISYHLKKEENKCVMFDEKFYVYNSTKASLIPFNKNKVELLNIGIYHTWDVNITEGNIFLRCLMDCYYVMNYNENYFKLLTSELDTIYLCKTPCQSNDCFIPKNVEPAPF